jgi:sulfonate transport system substrate-binding protein
MRNRLVYGLLFGLTLLIGCGKKADPAPIGSASAAPIPVGASELRIATQPAPIYAPIFIAKQKGWLEEDLKGDGVTVKWSSFVAGPPENESFFAGQQDVGVIGDTPAIIARAAGLKSRIIGLSATGPKALAIIARGETKIEKPEQLRGTKIGVTKGSYAHHLLALVLEKAGLKTSDVNIIHLPPADLVNAFNSGDVDAASTWEPFLSRIEKGSAKRIADGTGLKQGALVIFAIDAYAQRNPRIIDKFLKAYVRGYEFLKEHPKEGIDLIAPEVKLEPAQLEKVLTVLDFNPAITPATYDELKATESFLRSNGLSRAPVDINAFVDESYVKAAGINK